MNKPLLLAICVAISSAAFAQAPDATDREARRQQMREKAEARFTASDRNRDGKLSFAEWQEARNKKMSEQFRKLDGNNDGALSQDELRQGHQQRRQMRGAHRQQAEARRTKLRALDIDKDQALTRAEIGDRMPKLSENFERIDSNRDGKLTREEIRAARATMRAPAR